jgi:hypothetical protein
MNNFIDRDVSLEKCPALVLNADYRPLSYYPLSLWSWQDTVKSVFLDRVIIVSTYDRVVRSPSFNMQLPSVIALKDYIVPQSQPSLQDLMFSLEISFHVNIVEVVKNLPLIIYYLDLKGERQIGITLLQHVQRVT